MVCFNSSEKKQSYQFNIKIHGDLKPILNVFYISWHKLIFSTKAFVDLSCKVNIKCDRCQLNVPFIDQNKKIY